jgi:NAD(P)-dependent dehydrogenase (short-subunit alcohol dehydrogenase family)
MKILVIGANGTVGKAVVAELAQRHEVIEASQSRGPHRIDVLDSGSIRGLFAEIGKVDAIVTTTGRLHFGPLAETTPEQFRIGLDDKLMGQVKVVLAAHPFVTDGGSFTLTSGILDIEPVRHGANATTVNAAIAGFVRAAAVELPRGLRINAVSPTVLTESLDKFGPYFRGFESAPASRVALAYSRSVEGVQTGRVYRVG